MSDTKRSEIGWVILAWVSAGLLLMAGYGWAYASLVWKLPFFQGPPGTRSPCRYSDNPTLIPHSRLCSGPPTRLIRGFGTSTGTPSPTLKRAAALGRDQRLKPPSIQGAMSTRSRVDMRIVSPDHYGGPIPVMRYERG